MDHTVRVYSDKDEVAARLKELEVGSSVLRTAALFGMEFLKGCTAHDPPSLKGMLVWGKITRSLRDQLVPAGWTKRNNRNYSTTVHPNDKYVIAVAAGDSNTGNPNSNKTTRTEKGPATKDAVQHNYQMSFSSVSSSFAQPEQETALRTWLLLHYADETTKQVKLELSLACGMDLTGHVTQWSERIILEPALYDEPSAPQPSTSDAEPIVVPVHLRSG